MYVCTPQVPELMELGELLPGAVERLLKRAGPLPAAIAAGGGSSRAACPGSAGDAGDATPVAGCPRHLAPTRAALQRDAAALFARLDSAGDGAIAYQHFVERLQALPRDSLLPYGLAGDRDIVQFATSLWDLKYGPQPPVGSGGDLERALYGRAPSHALFHEHCLDHATHMGPQGRGTVSVDTRAQLTMTCGEFQRLIAGVGAGAEQMDSRRLRPARAWAGAGAPGGQDEGEETPRRREEMLIDLDVPARVGLRVAASEWFLRNQRKHGWPDVSGGTIGTITRLVRVPLHVPWHYSTHDAMTTAVRERRHAVDSCGSAGDGLEVPGRQTEFGSMFDRKTHQHHGALLAHHIARAQRGRASPAFVKRSRPASAAAQHSGAAGAGASGRGDAHAVSSTNSERPWSHLHGTCGTYTTHDRQQTHVLPQQTHVLPPSPHQHGRQEHGPSLHLLQAAVPSKAFSRKSAAFWALPHAWGFAGSHHWAHPGRNWGWPTMDHVDHASLATSHHGAGPDARGVQGTLVAMVEWDNGNVGEYALRHHPHALNAGQKGQAAGVCMATLVLARCYHARASRFWQQPLKMLTRMPQDDAAQRQHGAAACAIGCRDANYASSPQVGVSVHLVCPNHVAPPTLPPHAVRLKPTFSLSTGPRPQRRGLLAG